ncbi:MAG: hypothetical protein CEN89_730 [Candidatus Berkelbacteria bacterium Licking1014_7]|uniref:Uncharacterized protein n=1 Tax=Candidatus Berkelbacteria bacterium Licking1014_7 TaxID=2017147 RepID=A0A554LIA3_9BACT|nr:MAG: hypothetical protein CEN89_730 [Candidatus Berkelbacteria bacterium Licking1014_7]
MFSRILIFLVALGLGFVGIKYNYWIVKTLGKSAWVEQKLGSGATFGFYKLVAIAIMILGFMHLIGVI